MVRKTVGYLRYETEDELKRQIVKIQNQLIEMVTLKNDSVPSPKEVNLV